MAGRVGQQRDDIKHFHEGPRPAMAEQQRKRLWALAALVNEMNILILNAGFVLGQCVDAGFGRPLVEFEAPVIHHTPHFI